MEFRIADTFTASLNKLPGQAQKATKTTAFDLQLNPANPGIRFHKLDRAKDPNFWSVSVNMDIRLIVHRTESSLLLCYVDHHDKAYQWAKRRKIERHPKTGAAQLVEIRERIEEIIVQQTVPQPLTSPTAKPLFAHIPADDLLSYGIPAEWLEQIPNITEANLFDIAERLPQEAAEALLELATGGTPVPAQETSTEANPFDHPDAQRRFRVMTNLEELERALDYPWEKWTVFLHPAQRHLVERSYSGPARISGSAGTGKTIVALHRAVFLARQNPIAKILLTTFSDPLAQALQIKLQQLVGNEESIFKRIQVFSIDAIAYTLYIQHLGQPNIVNEEDLRSLFNQSAQQYPERRFSKSFLIGEWQDIVDAWQIRTWADYRDVPRLGRKTRIGGKQREILWAIFEDVLQKLTQKNLTTWPQLFRQISEHLHTKGDYPFDFTIVDEAQDISIAQLKFLKALQSEHKGSLFFTGDLGQRIFQQPFSWKSVGVNIQGRSHTLKINYRTSHQIRQQCDRLLPSSIKDVDGNLDNRKGTISVFNGPEPRIQILATPEEEAKVVRQWISDCVKQNISPDEMGVCVRTQAQIARASDTITKANIQFSLLDGSQQKPQNSITLSTMHLVKGLEFRAMAVIGCDDEVIPLQSRIENISDEADLDEIYNTERHLLYVACTRAREHLLITATEPPSEFLDDMRQA